MSTRKIHPNLKYNPQEIEPRWKQTWERAGIYQVTEDSQRPKFYCLDYFPYPSGEGLHVGHCRNYVPTDLISRYKRMRGFNVLHPMGWDAFGEPAEQNAIQSGITPRETTDRNTANYKRQMKMIGTSYDWSREIDSSSPEYYRWTQSMFLKMFSRGVAYRDTSWQWWCPTCATTLSSHEIEGDRCWRGHPGVTKREIPAWFFKITAYADELIAGLDSVDWPESIKTMQRNWIGRSEGVEIHFPIKARAPSEQRDISGEVPATQNIITFTTRPDTIYGVTFIAVAPEHPDLSEMISPSQRKQVARYVDEVIKINEIQRTSENRALKGVFTGSYAVNPINAEPVPVFVADYVLPTYGTGAVMGVPAHDRRDYIFAKNCGLDIRPVIKPEREVSTEDWTSQGTYTGPGVMVNSGAFSGLETDLGGQEIIGKLERKGSGRRKVQYHMRDWLISRQRYWGTPIPIIHCQSCGMVPVPEEDLPVMLPKMENFTPDGSGMSPLASVPEFVDVPCPKCEGPAQRETDTMGGFACSSWYFLRFTSPDEDQAPFDEDAMKYWMPVDLYVGGAEHAVLHLLYARFWTKFLADEGLLPFREPFARLANQGQLHGPDGQRMSKSRGNVIIPDDMVTEYGADSLRIHGLFMAPFDQNVDWNTDGMVGARRFLNKVWTLFQSYWSEIPAEVEDRVDPVLERERHKVIEAVTTRIEGFRFNTMVSALMEYVNFLYEHIPGDRRMSASFRDCLETLLILLAPAAPHITEELWKRTGHEFSIHQQTWPEWDPTYFQEDSFEIPIQVNGRRRSSINISRGMDEASAVQRAIADETIQKYLQAAEITRTVYVPGKILNIVTK